MNKFNSVIIMNLRLQKKLSSKVLKVSPKKIHFDEERLEEIKEAITKSSILKLAKDQAIIAEPKRGISRVRARKIKEQKAKGRRKGKGSRKGKITTRVPKKETWMNKVRLQREFLKTLKDKQLIDTKIYRKLYLMSKGGFFRSKRHIQIYLNDHDLILKNNKINKIDSKN